MSTRYEGIDTTNNPAMYDLTVALNNERAMKNARPVAIGAPVNATLNTVAPSLDLSGAHNVPARPYTLDVARRNTMRVKASQGMEKFLVNSLSLHGAIVAGDGIAVLSIMREPCIRYFTRMLLKKLSMIATSDLSAYEETCQDVAVMLMELAPMRKTTKGATRQSVALADLTPTDVYRLLCGRAYRLALHNYGIGKNRAPMLTRATKKAPAQLFHIIPLDAYRGATQSAEHNYIADETLQAQLTAIDNAPTEPATRALFACFTKGERSALRLYLRGITTSGAPIVRARARLASLTKSGALTESDIHALLLAISRETDLALDRKTFTA